MAKPQLAAQPQRAPRHAGRPKSRSDITVAEIKSLQSTVGRVQASRIVAETQSDPLGIVIGEYRDRKRWSIGDATPERMQHAKAAGVRLSRESETFEDGRETGLQRKRFISKLETFRSRGALTSEGYAAAERYRSHVDIALAKGPGQSVSYEPRMIDHKGHPDLHPIERSMDYWKKVAHARRSIPHELHCVLDWIERTSNDEISVDAVAARYWPELNARSRDERFKGLLELTCALLARHYGMVDEHKWAKLQISRTAQELAERMKIPL
jgi:hypothetical protein